MSAEEKGRSSVAITAGLVMVVIYSIQFIAGRYSLRDHLSPSDLTVLRFLGASGVFATIWAIGGMRSPFAIGWRRAVVLTLMAGLPYPLVINAGLSMAPAVHAAALCPAAIVWFSFLFSRAFVGEPGTPAKLIGITSIAIGLVAFAFGSISLDSNIILGDLLFLSSGAMFSVYAVLVKRWEVDPLTAVSTTVFLSMPVLPLLFLTSVSGIGLASNAEILGQALIQGVLAGGLAFFLYTYVVAHLGAHSASLFMPSIPILTAVGGAFCLGEHLSVIQITAIGLVVGGMACSPAHELLKDRIKRRRWR